MRIIVFRGRVPLRLETLCVVLNLSNLLEEDKRRRFPDTAQKKTRGPITGFEIIGKNHCYGPNRAQRLRYSI